MTKWMRILALPLAMILAVAGLSFMALPASAETAPEAAMGSADYRLERKVTGTSHNQIKGYAGEHLEVMWNLEQPSATWLSSLQAGDVLTMLGASTAEDKIGAALSTPNACMDVVLVGAEDTSNGCSDSLTIPEGTTSVTKFSLHSSQSATVIKTGTFKLRPKLMRTRGDTSILITPSNEGDNDVSIKAGVTSHASITARTDDSMLSVYLPTVCVDTSELSVANTLRPIVNVSNGKTEKTVPIHGAWGWSTDEGPGEDLSEPYTLPTSFDTMGTLSVSLMGTLDKVRAGTTYSTSVFSIVKSGTKINRLTTCGTSAARMRVPAEVRSRTVTATITENGDRGIDGSAYKAYSCALYKVKDADHKTVLARNHDTAWTGKGECTIINVPKGKYVIGYRAIEPNFIFWLGLSTENFTRSFTVK